MGDSCSLYKNENEMRNVNDKATTGRLESSVEIVKFDLICEKLFSIFIDVQCVVVQKS